MRKPSAKKLQTLLALLIVSLTIAAALAGIQEPLVIAVLLMFPPILFLFGAGAVATAWKGFLWPSLMCGLLGALAFSAIGVEEHWQLLVVLFAFIVPFAWVQLLVDTVRYVMKFVKIRRTLEGTDNG